MVSSSRLEIGIFALCFVTLAGPAQAIPITGGVFTVDLTSSGALSAARFESRDGEESSKELFRQLGLRVCRDTSTFRFDASTVSRPLSIRSVVLAGGDVLDARRACEVSPS